MSQLRDRLDADLAQASEAYRSLVPTDRQRILDEVIAEFLHERYAELRDAVRGRFAKMPPPPGKGDSWSW